MSTKLGTLTLDLVAKISNFSEPMKKAGDTAQKESKRIESSINSATKAITALGATALAGLTVGAVIESADAYGQMAARIRNATKDTEEYDLVQKRLLNTANGTYRALGEAQEVYLGLSGGLKELGYNTQQVLDISDSLSYSFVHNATSADKAQSAMSAYGKVLDKGKVEADSWFSIMAAVPNILDDVAKATNKLPSEIRKLGAEGKLAAEDLNKGFLLSRDANQALADAMENSLADGMFALKNGFSVLVGEANMATGATSTLAAGLATVGDVLVLASDNLDVLAVAGGTAAAVLALKMTPAIWLSGKAFVSSSIDALKYQVAVTRLSAQISITSTTMTIMGGAARGALAVLGGPVGLVLTVATVAASYALFRDKTKDSTVSLRENNETVEEAIKKYTELDKIKRAGQLVEEREKLEELTDAYGNANNALISYAWRMTRSTDMTTTQAREFNSLVGKYKSGEITLEQLSDAVGKNTNFTQKQKDEFIKHASSLRSSSDAMNTQKGFVEKLIDLNPKLAKSHDGITSAIDRQKNAYASLSEQQKKVYDSIDKQLQREKYIQLNVSNGTMSREQAEYFADKRIEAGIPFNEKLSKVMYTQIEAGRTLEKQNEARLESEKKSLEAQKKKAEFAEKNYSYSKSDLQILERVSKLNAEHSLNKISAKQGVPDNLVAAIIAQESGGLINAKSPTGAIGPGQTTSIFRKQYGLSVADSYDVKKVAEAITTDLAKSFEVFGNWKDAVTAYNAGVAGTKSLNAKGFTGSAAKTKEARNYAPSVDKFFAGLNGSSSKSLGFSSQEAVLSIKELGEYWENVEAEKAKSLARQKTVMQAYYSEEEAMAEAHEQAKVEIEKAFAGNKELIAEYLAKQEKAYQKDVNAFKEAQHQKAISAYEAVYNPLANMQSIGMNATAMATLSPAEYQKWELNNQHQAGYSQLADSFSLTQQAINDSEYISETEKYAQLEAIYEQYLQNKASLAEQYAVEEQKLIQSQHDAQMGIWQDLLTRTGTVFSQMAEMVKNTSGESSAAYKAMFLTNQAISMAQALINTEVAATKAMAEGGMIAGIPMATAIRALGYASVGMIGAQTIAGMAHDGIDNVPKEGTWLLDKGERVVDSRTNSDLKNYLSNQKQQAPQITINNNANADVQTRQNSDGSIDIDLVERQLANRLSNANSVISKSLKQNTTASRRR
ncbi:tape measure protein [Acinetobacter equi]|uniref:Uncharacterized protein n=1 Tax=Acinetobacter equi TaxID=1324350 RepID=A0A0N9VWM7_9GAMM|nr:tape measure protein [Acinetobacter equi]ALH95594.1 hypothetical protein AOY20_08690 [Acinetobacter equi]